MEWSLPKQKSLFNQSEQTWAIAQTQAEHRENRYGTVIPVLELTDQESGTGTWLN